MPHETKTTTHTRAAPTTTSTTEADAVKLELAEIAFLFAFLASLIWFAGLQL